MLSARKLAQSRQKWWILPILSAIIWWVMLIALFACWASQGRPQYPEMTGGETIPYISHIAATNLQPVFISLAAAQGLLFVAALGSERWLRHRGVLARSYRRREKWLSVASLVLAVIGQLGILFVSCFNTVAFHNVHMSMLVIFIIFVGLSVITGILEYSVLDTSYKHYGYLKKSMWLKAGWLVVAAGLGFSFLGTMWSNEDSLLDPSAVLEWTLAFWYPFYTLVLAYDLWPTLEETGGHVSYHSGSSSTGSTRYDSDENVKKSNGSEN